MAQQITTTTDGIQTTTNSLEGTEINEISFGEANLTTSKEQIVDIGGFPYEIINNVEISPESITSSRSIDWDMATRAHEGTFGIAVGMKGSYTPKSNPETTYESRLDINTRPARFPEETNRATITFGNLIWDNESGTTVDGSGYTTLTVTPGTLEVTSGGESHPTGLVLQSQNGNLWRITVSDLGVLSTTRHQQ